MKLSNKILLITGILLLVAITYTVLGFKKVATEGRKRQITDDSEIKTLLNSEITTKQYALENFDRINLSVEGRVSVKYSKENWSVEISAPQKMFESEFTEVKKEENTLSIETPLIGEGQKNNKVYITITLPEINKLKLQDRTKLKLDNFTQDNLSIDVLGECMLQGSRNRIEKLVLQSHGANKISFSESKIKNALINGFGKNQIELFMTGGNLTGSMGGAGVLVYSGEVEKVNVDTFGSTKIVNNTSGRTMDPNRNIP